jgi:L-arabinonolactonase
MFRPVTESSVILDCRNCLGESILWDDRAGLLYWVNIHDAEIWAWNACSDTEPRVFRLPERVGALGLRESGGLILALESGFACFDTETTLIERLADVEEDLPSTRLNDGRVDLAGRFVCGGMDEGNPQRPISAVYSLGASRRPQELISCVSCANSICWSPDGATMYFTDMPTQRIDAFDYDAGAGQLSNRRPFVSLANQPGSADGSIVDSEGCLWNAQWRGSKIVRYRPDGSVDCEIPLPVSNPTCLAFGGEDLDVLFVTTAWFTLTPEERNREPYAGSIFSFRPGVCGRREYRYIG